MKEKKSKKIQIYNFLPDYPKHITGGIMYHTIVFDYLAKRMDNIHAFGKNYFTKYISKSKPLIIISGFIYFLLLPKKSVLFTTNTEFSYFSLPVFLFKKLKKISLFLTVHHLLTDEEKKKYRDKLEKYYTNKADYLTAASNVTMKRLREYGIEEKQITVISPGIALKSGEKLLEEKSFNGNKILFVGTIEKRKGIIVLIEALKNANIENFELNIVGRILVKEYFDLLQERIKEYGLENNVNFYSHLSEEELRKLYTDSFMFIFPSYMEGFGIVILEAMSFANFILASKLPSVMDIMEENEEGIYFDAGDSKKLAKQISFYWHNRMLAKQIALNAYKKSSTFDDWDSVGEKYLKLFKEIE